MKMTPEELAAHEGYQRFLAQKRAWGRAHRKEVAAKARERWRRLLANETPREREARLAKRRAQYRKRKAERDGS